MIRFSAVYESAATDITDQAAFLNAVALIKTDEDPQIIAKALQKIEKTLKKAPPFRFGPRTIDLDILLYGNQKIETDALHIPHPRMHQRRFVLEPLTELLDKNEMHPTMKKTWKELLNEVQEQECKKVKMKLL
jgi:2-amino-4-hydroxy-6-hydroxymethyldihydropteridine diphosphokinase